MFSVFSWNILQGGGSRLLSILHEIDKIKPTVLVFSEYHNNESGISLRQGILRQGYRHQLVTNAAPSENSVLIASMLPCDSEQHPTSDKEFGSNIISAHFELFSIMGVYLPHKKKHTLFDFILDHVEQSTKPYIIVGDYNSGINGIDQSGDSFWYEDKMKALQSKGYIDAFRLKNGDTRAYSWYSHQGNGFRYDHTFLHHSLQGIVTECKYIHELRERKISDHSPMYLKLG
jgi:exodeoxyribonuclease III